MSSRSFFRFLLSFFQVIVHLLVRCLAPLGAWISGNRRRLFARGGMALAFLTLLSGPASPLVTWSGVAYAHTSVSSGAPWRRDPGKPNRFNPKFGATSVSRHGQLPATALSNTPATPHPILHSAGSMQPGLLSLTPGVAATFVGSDGHFEVAAPAGAITAADAAAAGGSISLSITQIAPGGGSNAGGSGLVSFGTFMIQVVGANGALLTTGLRKPVQLVYHYGSRESALDLTKVLVDFNGSLPVGVKTAPIGMQTTPQSAGRVASGGVNTPIYPTSVTPTSIGLGKPSLQRARLDLKGHRLLATASLATPSSSMSWDTDSPVAVFGRPDPFNVDLSAGTLSDSIPIETPAGPGGLTPSIALSYSSAGVSEQHNVQGAAGWVGEGWNLSLGSISWAEHNVTSNCVSTCGNTWEDSWQLSDPYGTSAELIPPNINVSTYYDDSPNNYCGADSNANNSTSYPCPIQWHTAPETRAKVFTYISSFSLPDGAPKTSCFRAFLPSGIMEEFGCTQDSLEYYYTPGMGDYISTWNLDLITDARGNQIHITYNQDTESKDFKVGTTDYGTHKYIRDAVLSGIQWDSPGCLNTQAACTGSAWNPQMQMVFFASHVPTHYPVINSPACNTGSNLRCDDPLDLSSSTGMAAPQVQSDYALNDIEVQVRPSATASWNVLDGYSFSYSESGPSTITDPTTGTSESVAGSFLLTQMQKYGTNYGVSSTQALPPQTFTYVANDVYYEDSAYHPNLSTNCGPSWNTGNGSGCLLWSRSYAGNDEYLATADNGLGQQTTFSWALARNNTHGVNGGGANASNPYFCGQSQYQSSYPCNEADDQNWSRMTLTSMSSSVTQALSSGSQPLTSTSNYGYWLTYPLNAQECSDCVAGMYWGNQNDGDYLDYYNGKFMGFAEADVTNPDKSLIKHKFYATNGYGVYDTSQVNNYSSYTLHNSPWWNAANVLHGHEYEVDTYDTDGATLLSKATTQYQTSCPPDGASGTPSSTAWGTWNGNLVSELDHNNPVAACEIFTSQTDQYTYDGATSGPHVTTTYSYTYDGSGHDKLDGATATVNGGANGSPTTIQHETYYVWNDAISATSTSAAGTYIAHLPGYVTTRQANVQPTQCENINYKGSTGGGAMSGLTDTLPIARVDYTTTCGWIGNNWATAGGLNTSYSYDSFGNNVSSTDADANAGISGHTGCTLSGTSYTSCLAIDGAYDALPVSSTNDKNQTSTTNYTQSAGGGWGLWPTSITDSNNQSTSFTYDTLGRMTSQTLPGESSGATTTNWTYTNWCAATGAQAPCLELDQTQRVNSTTTITSRAFYDGAGRLVETRAPGPNGQDVIVYAEHDVMGRVLTKSTPYFVSAYTGAPGSAAFSTPDTTQPKTTFAYPTQRETSVTDALSHTTTTIHSTQCGVGSDTGCYASVTTIDPVGHQHVALTDGFGRAAYDQTFIGTASPYTLYAQTSYGYNLNGNLVTLTRPDGKNVTYTYDLANRKTGMTDPDRGTETYSYDPNGNATQTVDARGASGTIYAAYDGLNRQLWRNSTNSATGAYVTYSYDSTAGGNLGVGRLTSESFSNANAGGALSGSYAYTYDARGEVASSAETLGAASYTTSATYNDAGQLLSQTYPNGDILSHSYDSASGWATQLSLQQSGATSAVSLLGGETYAGAAGAMGLLTSAILGGFSSGAGAYSASYDTLGRLTSSAYSYTPAGGAASTLYQVQPTYDALSNVIGVTTTLPQGVDTQIFCYDDLARLTWAGSSGTPACSGAPTPSDTGSLSGTGASYSASYAYDSMNRLTSAPQGAYTYGDSAHADAATAVGSAWTASYDAAGNMTCRAASSATSCAGAVPTGTPLSYDNEGRLASWQNLPTAPSSTATYLYDGEGQRVEQVAASPGTTTTTAYIGSLEEVTTSGGATTTTTTTAYYGKLALSVNGALSYTLSDGLGSVSASVNTNGTVTASQLYGPYGAARYQNGTLPTSKGYTGQRSDAATSGLDYYGARYYDPVAGQFTSADTVLAGGLNRYAYVAGNPETRTDPSGHMYVRPTGGGAATGGAATGGAATGGGGAQGSGAHHKSAAHHGSSSSSGGGWGQVALAVGWQALDATTGIPSMIGDVQTLFNPNTSTLDKVFAGADLAFNLFMDVTMVIGVGEGLRAAYVGAHLAADVTEHVLADTAEHAAEDAVEHTVEDGVEHSGENAATTAAEAGGGCGKSFTPDTLVATPSGERPIASLTVGQQVTAYDPATGKTTRQTIVRMFLNHDSDRLDVTLAYPTAGTRAAAAATAAAATAAERTFGTATQAGHRRSLLATTTGMLHAVRSEVIHTTASHPWLTADRGWVRAGQLHLGEPVRLLDGVRATVVKLHTVPGVGAMWDLSLDATHTFAVGDVQAVVHNCGTTQPEPPSPSTLQDGGSSSNGGGRSGARAQNYGDPNSYVRSVDGKHAWVYDANGRRTWDISAERAKPIYWNQAPDGQMFPQDSGLHLPVPDEWKLLFP